MPAPGAGWSRPHRSAIAWCAPLALGDLIIDVSNTQEPVLHQLPGDDQFTSQLRARDLPLGNLTSQLFANISLDGLDHVTKDVVQEPCLRDTVDFAPFSNSPAELAEWQARIAQWLQGRRLALHPGKTHVVAASKLAAFLGLVLHRGGLRRLPGADMARFCQRLQRTRQSGSAGQVAPDNVHRRVAACSSI